MDFDKVKLSYAEKKKVKSEIKEEVKKTDGCEQKPEI